MMGPCDDNRQHEKLSRRGFLAGTAVGVGAKVTPVGAFTGIRGEQFVGNSDPSREFGRIFRLPAFAENTQPVREALLDFGRLGGPLDAKDDLSKGPASLITDPGLSINNPDNSAQTAGMAFLGQFLDHEITFDSTSKLAVTTRPADTRNSRTPLIDLDAVYGRGPEHDPQFYDPADPAKFVVGSGGKFEDLPRAPGGAAVIPDPRNDQTLIIAGLHAALLLFHNRAVDMIRRPRTGSRKEGDDFAQARRLVTWHFQWIIMHQFLPLVVGQQVVDDILARGRRFYRPSRKPFMPVEFSVACFRLGHSLIRPSYQANLKGDNGSPFFGFIFDPAGDGQSDPVDLRGGARAVRRFIDWQNFFDFGTAHTRQLEYGKLLDTKISTPLFRLPLTAISSHDAPVSLPQRNLLRHLTFSLPAGQRVARAMREPILDASHFPELAPYRLGLDANTPLWYYTLREAEHFTAGTRLGPVGGRIVGEVIIGLLEEDPRSYLAAKPDWRPTLPGATPGDFRMTDLLTFAKVDPASRGQ